jgi:hypothetical protein
MFIVASGRWAALRRRAMWVSVMRQVYRHMALLWRANLFLADSTNIGLLTEAVRDIQLRCWSLHLTACCSCSGIELDR